MQYGLRLYEEGNAGGFSESVGPLYQCLGINPCYPGASFVLACADVALGRFDAARERFGDCAGEPDKSTP